MGHISPVPVLAWTAAPASLAFLEPQRTETGADLISCQAQALHWLMEKGNCSSADGSTSFLNRENSVISYLSI